MIRTKYLEVVIIISTKNIRFESESVPRRQSMIIYGYYFSGIIELHQREDI